MKVNCKLTLKGTEYDEWEFEVVRYMIAHNTILITPHDGKKK